MLTARERAMFKMRPAEMEAFFNRVRAAGGDVPLIVTNGDRSPADTARISGAQPGGCHEQGKAMDVVPVTANRAEWVRRISAAIDSGQLQVGEFFWYPFDGHAHLTLPGCGGNNEQLVKESREGNFTSLAAWLTPGGKAFPFLLLFLFVGVIFLSVKGGGTLA